MENDRDRIARDGKQPVEVDENVNTSLLACRKSGRSPGKMNAASHSAMAAKFFFRINRWRSMGLYASVLFAKGAAAFLRNDARRASGAATVEVQRASPAR
jgi:hypothetical protein